MIVFVIYILVGRKGTCSGGPTLLGTANSDPSRSSELTAPDETSWRHRRLLQPAAASRRIIIGLFSSVINVGDLLIEAERPARNQELMIYIGRTFPLGIFFLQRQKAMFLEAIICLQCIRRKKDI